jgi:hypothetical protein
LDKWQNKFPQETGCWWFYGWRFDKINRITTNPNKPELIFVKVRKISNGYCHIADGQFMYEEESAGGKWLKATLPRLPSLENTLKERK